MSQLHSPKNRYTLVLQQNWASSNGSCYKDPNNLISTAYGIKSLSRALLNLANCRRIRIKTDHPTGKAGQHSNQSKVAYNTFHAILAAIAMSHAQIELLDISIGSSMESMSRITPSILIGPSTIVLAKSQISSLRQLRLVLNPSNLTLATEPSDWVPSLLQFINLLPNLSHLALEFEDRDTVGRFSEICTLMRISKLQGLTVGWTDCTSMELTFLLLRHRKTLREINLNCISLLDDIEAWRWLVETIRDSLDIGFFSMTGSMTGDRDLIDPDGMETLPSRLEATDAQGLGDIADFLSYNQLTKWGTCY
ncbi:hypothetical protein FSARC_173 [Fusarium sarcochroum]|uniref:Uncharacterized protein n=1 Tax=Fusarium sarcochroum TaxID=1208366 RepID=A0A8H4XGT7_9HYPO|nr:hypothetical protein FSARC_173 [Fusarium sarcochroum]